MSQAYAQINQAQLLASVLDSSLDGIMAFRSLRDETGRIVDFIWTVVNRRAEQLVGHKAHELLDRRLLEVMPGNGTDGLFEAYTRVVQTGEPFTTEHHYAHEDLNLWFNIRANKCGDGFAVTFEDVSERKSSDERFRVLFERSTDAHLLYDDNGIIDCNRAAVEMLGYDDKRELLNIHPATLSPEYQPDGMRSEKKKCIQEALVNQHGFARFDWVHLRKDGREIPVEVTLNPVQIAGKAVMLVVWHDLSKRKEAERRLRETAEHLAQAQELAKIGSWEWRPTTNQIIWSEQARRIFGLTPDQPTPDFESHQQQIHPDDLNHWRSVVDRAMRDHQPYVMKFRAVLPEKQVRLLEGRGRCEVDASGTIVRLFGTVQDITEQELAREELNKLSMVASRTDDGVVIADAQGRVEWVNRAFTQITGYSLDELRGNVPGHLLQGLDTDPKTLARIRENLASKHGFRETLLNYRKSGESYWVEIEVQPIVNDRGDVQYYMAIERDVTTKLHRERDLEQQRRRLDFALDASRSGLWDWNVVEGSTFYSDTWYTMLGYEPGELPMSIQTWVDLTEPEDLKRAKAAIEDYFNGKSPRYRSEHRVRNKAGQWQWILDVGEAVERDAQGRVTRMIGLHLDIHAQKLAQLKLEEALKQAQQASAMKSAFVANMSHEIRTPMNAILGYADLLLDPHQNGADRRNHAQTIRRNGRHLMNLLNDVLDISKIEAGKMSVEQVPCAPGQLFADIISLMMPRAMAKGIDLSFEAIDRLPLRITTDPTRVRQVLLNLIDNAIKFTSEGSVRIVVRSHRLDDSNIELVCDVIDTGIGLDENQADNLFKPFSQADDSTTRRFGGTGLGLAISHNLCQLLGGELRCTSTPGVGSTFTASFRVGEIQATEPAVANKPASPAASAASATADALAGRRVLVVEDAQDNQRLIQHYLAKSGAQVVLAENGALGRDAAIKARQQGRAFDIILMDMQMPLLDGYSATRQLRAAGCNEPILALTAHASADDRNNCLGAGCNGYLTKPVDRHNLIRVILSHILAPIHQGAAI